MEWDWMGLDRTDLCQERCSGPTPSQCPVPTEYKRARHEIKKKSSDTLKLQKKARKGQLGEGLGWGCGGTLAVVSHVLSLSPSLFFPSTSFPQSCWVSEALPPPRPLSASLSVSPLGTG